MKTNEISYIALIHLNSAFLGFRFSLKPEIGLPMF